jgi:hypothetical protein
MSNASQGDRGKQLSEGINGTNAPLKATHSANFLLKHFETNGQRLDFIHRLEKCSLEELAQSWRSRSLNNYNVNFLQTDSPDVTLEYLLDSINKLTNIKTRKRSRPYHDKPAAKKLNEEKDSTRENNITPQNNRRQSSDSNTLRALHEEQALSLYPWIQELIPKYRNNKYDYDFSKMDEKNLLTFDNDGGVLAMTPMKWIETLTSAMEKRSPADIHTFLLTYRAFMEPIMLLKHLVHRFFYPIDICLDKDDDVYDFTNNSDDMPRHQSKPSNHDNIMSNNIEEGKLKIRDSYRRKTQRIIRLNVVSFLRIWITRFYKEDFSMDIVLREHFEDFFQYILLTKPKGIVSWIRSLKAKLDALVVADATKVKLYYGASDDDYKNDNVDETEGANDDSSLLSAENVALFNFLRSVLKRAESSTDISDFTEGELKRTAVAIQNLHLIKTKSHQYHLRWYKNCFRGKEFVDALCDTKFDMCKQRMHAILLGNYLLQCGLLNNVADDHVFKDVHTTFYRFYSNDYIKEAIRHTNNNNTVRNNNNRSSAKNLKKNSYYSKGKLIGKHVKNNSSFPKSILPVGGVTLDLFISRNVSRLFHGDDGLNAFYHISPKEVARQITLVDFEVFKKIEHFEWLEKRFSDKNREILAPNICAAVNRFNALTGHVTYAVLAPLTCESRARVLEHWLRIAGECHGMNNFSSLYSIFCGINSTPVYRLKKTWALVNVSLLELFEVFSVLFAPQKNSINFRNSLNSAILPAIPHVGMFLSDLTFNEDGNATVLPCTESGFPKKINVMKLCKVAGIIERAEEFQAAEYCFHPVEGLSKYIGQFREHERDELYDLSYLREPKKSAGRKKGRIV